LLETIDRAEFDRRFSFVTRSVGTQLLGKAEQIELSVACLLADGHLLLEDLPGLGKTRLARALAGAFGGHYRRVQGTSDLLPTDITGSVILDRKADGTDPGGRTDGFRLRLGPVFANVVLCDEINRTPPRTQAALLEAMEERQVTIFDETRLLPDPFFVIATQNPVEMSGTYALPEAQLDRFLMRLELGYPDSDVFRTILDDVGRDRPGSATRTDNPPSPLSPVHVLQMIDYAHRLPVATVVRDYIADIVEATRDPQRVTLGASPRAGLALLRAARAYAAGRGGTEVHSDHVRVLAPHVLAHRIVLCDPPMSDGSRAQFDFVRDVVDGVKTGKRIR
jgi:MoxR-like ATPase